MYLGKPDAARATLGELETVARTDGERRLACTWRVASYLHEGDYDAALAELEQRHRIAEETDDRPATSADRNLAGNILLAAGQAGEALKSFDASVEILAGADVGEDVKETARRNHLFNKGRVALASGDLGEAAAIADRYRDECDTHKVPFEIRQSHHLEGLVALAEGDYSTAVAELEQASDQDPRVLLALAKAHARLGEREAALTAAKQAADFNGLSLNLAFVRAEAQKLVAGLEGA